VNDIRHLFDLFLPVNHLWWAIFGQSFTLALKFLYNGMAAVPPLQFLGAYGLAIILLTVVIKVVLSPLYHFQLSVSRKTQAEQRRIAPEVAAVRKKFKNEPQKQQAALMELSKEHGINPLSSLTGCLPAVVQLPILTALYYVFLGNARTHAFVSDHFLWVPHLNDYPNAHPLFTGLPIPAVAYLVIPLLAAATTFVQSRMMQQPPNPNATEQEVLDRIKSDQPQNFDAALDGYRKAMGEARAFVAEHEIATIPASSSTALNAARTATSVLP